MLSNDVAYSNTDNGLVINETAKSQCDFFTLNSRRPPIQMTPGYLAPKPHCKKINYNNAVCLA